MKDENQQFNLLSELISITKEEMKGATKSEQDKIFETLLESVKKELARMKDAFRRKKIIDELRSLFYEKKQSEENEKKRVKIVKKFLEIEKAEMLRTENDEESQKRILDEMRREIREEMERARDSALHSELISILKRILLEEIKK
jgi:hypothetical protein